MPWDDEFCITRSDYLRIFDHRLGRDCKAGTADDPTSGGGGSGGGGGSDGGGGSGGGGSGHTVQTTCGPIVESSPIDDFNKMHLDAHNKYRSDHGVPPLAFDASLGR